MRSLSFRNFDNKSVEMQLCRHPILCGVNDTVSVFRHRRAWLRGVINKFAQWLTFVSNVSTKTKKYTRNFLSLMVMLITTLYYFYSFTVWSAAPPTTRPGRPRAENRTRSGRPSGSDTTPRPPHQQQDSINNWLYCSTYINNRKAFNNKSLHFAIC